MFGFILLLKGTWAIVHPFLSLDNFFKDYTVSKDHPYTKMVERK